MRVIAGSAKGTPLLAVKGSNTRPILDRVKESLFSIISNSIIESNIIDLFAGTGGLGIEALSRGAHSCLFIDNDYGAIQIIKKNLEKSFLLNKSEIIKSDVFSIDDNPEFGRYRDKKGDVIQFGVILVGAPYPVVEQIRTRESLFQLFKRFVEKQIISPDGIIVLQHKKEQLNIIKEFYKLEIYDSRIYGKTQITFLRPFKIN